MTQNFRTHFWEIGKISFPLTLATAAASILVFIDSLFATRVSIVTYEAVFLTIPILGVATGVGVGLAAAIADLISKESDLSVIKRLVVSSFVLAFICIALFIFIGLYHLDWIEGISGLSELASDSMIRSEFHAYWKIIVWALPMQILFALAIQFMTMLNKQRSGILIIIIMLIINVILDYYFVIKLSWGIYGLAYATIGVFSFGLLLSFYFLRGEFYFQRPLPSPFLRSTLHAFGRLTLSTFMIFLTIVIFSIAGIILNRMALILSSSALITFAIFRQIMEIIILTTRGFSGGFIIYMGNAIRDQNREEYFPIYWAGTGWIALVNGTGAILMLVFPELLIQFFDNIDPSLILDISYILMIAAAILFLFILPRLAQIGFISLNKKGHLVLFSIIYVIVLLIAAQFWIAQYGVFGLAYAELLATVVCLVIFLPLFFYYLNQKRMESEQAGDLLK